MGSCTLGSPGPLGTPGSPLGLPVQKEVCCTSSLFLKDTPYGEGHTVQCWFPGCNEHRCTYGELMDHVTDAHGAKLSAFSAGLFLSKLEEIPRSTDEG